MNVFRPRVSKTLKLIVITVITIIVITLSNSCVKKSNCDCGLEGKFVYYNPPKTETTTHAKHKVTAVFIPTDGIKRPIVGYIPIKYRIKDTIKVSVCLQHKSGSLVGTESLFYGLKCIEKIE